MSQKEFFEIDVDGGKLGVARWPGRGPKLLLVHGISASHMAFASVRMEPVFMILSESAGIAAHLAAKEDLPIQQTPYARILPKLRQRRQILSIEDVES